MLVLEKIDQNIKYWSKRMIIESVFL